MSEDNLFESSKRRVAIYFDPAIQEEAKNFAARVRNSQKAETILVWAKKFQDESHVLSVHGVVIQYDVPNRDLIAKMYNMMAPEAEVHFMTSEGTLYDPEADQPIFPTANTRTDEAPAQPVPTQDPAITATAGENDKVPAEQSESAESGADGAEDAEATAADAGSVEDGEESEGPKDPTSGASV